MRKKVKRKKSSKKEIKFPYPIYIDRKLIPTGWEWSWVLLCDLEYKHRMFGYKPIEVGQFKKLDERYKHLIGEIPDKEGKFFIVGRKFFEESNDVHPTWNFYNTNLILCEIPEQIYKYKVDARERETFETFNALLNESVEIKCVVPYSYQIDFENNYSPERNMSGFCPGKLSCILNYDTKLQNAVSPHIGDNGSFMEDDEGKFKLKFTPSSCTHIYSGDQLSYFFNQNSLTGPFFLDDVESLQETCMSWSDPKIRSEEDLRKSLLNRVNRTRHGSICY